MLSFKRSFLPPHLTTVSLFLTNHTSPMVPVPSQAPCAPVIQNHSLDCISNHALVTWLEDENAMGVTVNATSNLGHTTSCSSSTNTTCVLSGLACGRTYTIQAFAQGVQCLSKPSSAFTILTGLLASRNI